MDKNKWFHCHQCKFMFSQKNLLEKHMKTHIKFQGDLINKKISDNIELKLPSESPNSHLCTLSCLQCNFTTYRQSSLTNHIRKYCIGNKKTNTEKELPEPSEMPKCDVSLLSCLHCDFTTSRKSSLTNHTGSKICSGNKKTTENELTDRSEIQKSEKSTEKKVIDMLSCLQCDFKTNKSVSLRNHTRKHTSEKSFPCKQCWRRYTNKSSLNDHLLTCNTQGRDIQTETKTFVCTECDFKCNSNSGLKEHKGEHNLPTLFICQLCNAECRGESALKAHMTVHTEKEMLTISPKSNHLNDESYKHSINTNDGNNNVPVQDKNHMCNECGQNFLSHQNLKNHCITHSNEKYYSCLDCDFKTIYERSLTRHGKQHTSNNILACPECDFKTNIEQTLLDHMNKHKENRLKLKNFRNCTTSELSFKCSDSLDSSAVGASINHPTTNTNNCAINENTENSVQSHLAKQIKPSDITKQKTKLKATKEVSGPLENTSVVIPCEVKDCKETFTSLRCLKKHIQSHKLETMHNCNLCSYKSYSKSKLKRHEKINHRSHNCTECDFRCSSLEELKIHKQVHKAVIGVIPLKKNQLKFLKTGTKRVGKMSCNQCKAAFVSNAALKRHQRACRKGDLFKCDLCEYENAQSYNLVIHKEKHHQQSRLKCEMCSFKTLVAKRLEKHKLIHNVEINKLNKSLKTVTKSVKNGIPSLNMSNVNKIHKKITKKSSRVLKSKNKPIGKNQNLLFKTMPNINGKITCSLCNFTFETASGLYKHMKTHYGEKTFSCSKCPYKTHYSYNLKLHLEIHRFSRLLCLVCDYKCERLIDLNNHMIEKHNLVHNTNTNLTDQTVSVKEEIEICN